MMNVYRVRGSVVALCMVVVLALAILLYLLRGRGSEEEGEITGAKPPGKHTQQNRERIQQLIHRQILASESSDVGERSIVS